VPGGNVSTGNVSADAPSVDGTVVEGMSSGTVGVLVDESRAKKMIADPVIAIAAIPSGKASRRLGLFVVTPPARAARATFLAEDALPIGR
jgi:hypothetical protein